MERHTVRARWTAVGALAYWPLHLQSRFPHPQRLLEDVLVGPTAHPPRSGWAAVAAVRAFRLVGETGVLWFRVALSRPVLPSCQSPYVAHRANSSASRIGATTVIMATTVNNRR